LKTTRSVLAVPANNPKMVEKALASEADAVFLDLEDAVAPDNKPEARIDIVRALREFDWRGRPTTFRANALDTAWWYRDLIEVTEEAGGALDTVIIPKVRRPADLHAVDTLLASLEMAGGFDHGKVRIEAQIENAEGLVNTDSISSATDRLTALHFGPGDFAASLRMPLRSIGAMDEWDATYPGHRFHYAMQRIVAAARAAGLRALDGPIADYRDEVGLSKSCKVARSLGFDGKWCIHPAQIQTVNQIFSPTDEEVQWARKVMDSYEEANAARSGAVSVDGQMVDAASIRMAQNALDVIGESDR